MDRSSRSSTRVLVLPPDLYRIDLSSKQVTQLTFSNPPAMQSNKKVMPEIVSYKSFDGLEIPAFLYRPEKSNGAAILYPHGGPKDQYGFFWDELAQYFTAKGYTYLAPNYRGSTGYGKAIRARQLQQLGHRRYTGLSVMVPNSCASSKRFALKASALQAEAMAAT